MPRFDYACAQSSRQQLITLSADDPYWSRGKTMVLCPGCRNLHIISGPERIVEETREPTIENARRMRRAHDL